MNMILLLIVPVYLFLNYYVIRRIFHWLHLCSPHLKNRWFTATFVTLYALAASSLLFAFLLPSSGFEAAVRRFSNYWLGICFPYSGEILSLGYSPHTGRHLGSLSGSRRKFPGRIQCASDPHNRL